MSASQTNETVYTLDDLCSWDRSGTWLAVLGHPIVHSLSPHMHNAALKEIADEDLKYADWTYVKFDIPVEDLEEALGLLHEKQFRGVNLTIPHKVKVLDCIDDVDAAARAIGAVNTLYWTEAGYRGYNTDGYGVETAIQRNLGASLSEKPVIMLGAGGASRAAVVQCFLKGCKQLWLGNRSKGRLDDLIADVKSFYPNADLRGFLFEDAPVDLPKDALIINATSSGLKPDDAVPLDMAALSADSLLFDMIYNPPETVSMKAAAARGMRVANGLDMLIFQGARSLEIWTGREFVPEDAMRTAALAAKK